jgi:hypothetical protein
MEVRNFGATRHPAELRLWWRKLVYKHSLPNVWQDSFINPDPAVATTVVNSHSLLKSMKKCWLAAVFHHIILRSVTEQSNIKTRYELLWWAMPDSLLTCHEGRHPRRAMGQHLYHFIIINALFCIQSRWIHIILLTKREMLTRTDLRLDNHGTV